MFRGFHYTHQYGRLVWTNDLHLPVTAHHGLPYLVERWGLVFVQYCEERTVPSGHAIWLLISEDQVLEVLLFISSIILLIC